MQMGLNWPKAISLDSPKTMGSNSQTETNLDSLTLKD